MPIDAYPKTVTLKDQTEVMIRPVAQSDVAPLVEFFESLSDEERLYVRHDLGEPGEVRKWAEEVDLNSAIPLVALDGDTVAANGTLFMKSHAWIRHVAQIQIVTAPAYRGKGLGAMLSRELVGLAEERDIEKIQASVIEDNVGAVRMFETLGFKTVAVLEGMIKDRSWKNRNLAVMVNDVANLTQVMESWIQESMLASHRVPGDGA